MSLEEKVNAISQYETHISHPKTLSPYHYPKAALNISDRLLTEINKKNVEHHHLKAERFSRLGGSLAFHCSINLKERKITEAASMATLFRGYEALLPGRDLRKIGLVSATASGICGGVHATASALCLEMALDLRPPPLGIVMRNLLLCCQYLNDNPMHLFILSGPDYSQTIIQATNPELWAASQSCTAKNHAMHGYKTIADIMTALNKPHGELYLKALDMIRLAREAYRILGGQYPHSESIIPGGVNLTPSLKTLDQFIQKLEPFYDYAKQSIGLWDDVYDFMLEFDTRYQALGQMPATMIDFGQWDSEQLYDGCYQNCNLWGEHRWSTPAVIVNGKLRTTRLTEINVGLEEFSDHSYYATRYNHAIQKDPLGNPLSPYHPWNKKIQPHDHQTPTDPDKSAYSWGSAITWDRQVFEVGAYVRMYAAAISKKLPSSIYMASSGQSLCLELPRGELPAMRVEWKIPKIWNAFERNRARTYAIAFNLMVTVENYHRAKSLLSQGESQTSMPISESLINQQTGDRYGAGFWGAGRGFLAHWAVLKNNIIDNYQICVPSRINAAPRTPWGALGACEQAVINTPIIESRFKDASDFTGIDIQRCLQSFDPCMKCAIHTFFDDHDHVTTREIDTEYPI